MTKVFPCRVCGAPVRSYVERSAAEVDGRCGVCFGLRAEPSLPLRHAGNARLLTEAEIREAEAERGRRL